MSDSLFTDGQTASLVLAIVGGLGTVAAAIKWGIGRVTKAMDDSTSMMLKVVEKLAEVTTQVNGIAEWCNDHPSGAVVVRAPTQPEDNPRQTPGGGFYSHTRKR